MFIIKQENCIYNSDGESAFVGDIINVTENPGAVISGFYRFPVRIIFIDNSDKIVGLKRAAPEYKESSLELHLNVCDIINFSIEKKRESMRPEPNLGTSCRTRTILYLASPDGKTAVVGDDVAIKTTSQVYSGKIDSFDQSNGSVVLDSGSAVNVSDITGFSVEKDRKKTSSLGFKILHNGHMLKLLKAANKDLEALYQYGNTHYILHFSNINALVTDDLLAHLDTIEEVL